MNNSFDYRYLLKWIALISLLGFIFVMIYSVILYLDIEKSKVKAMPSTEAKIYKETDIVKINKIEPFYGESSYHIVSGLNKSEQKVIAFVPLSSSGEDIIIIDQVDIISKDVIYEKWAGSCKQCKMMKITPGIVDDKMIWELTYRDEKNRYVLEYYSISDGKQFERLRFTERFN